MSESIPIYTRPEYHWRECMTCDQPFKSCGNHHRICNNCKSHNTRADGEYAAMEATDTLRVHWR